VPQVAPRSAVCAGRHARYARANHGRGYT
jgi:hypothetical protein